MKKLAIDDSFCYNITDSSELIFPGNFLSILLSGITLHGYGIIFAPKLAKKARDYGCHFLSGSG